LAVVILAALIGAGFVATSAPTQALSADIVISQVYGAGGNSGALYNRDFVELFNRGSSPVTMTNWGIHYGSATGTSGTTFVVPVSGTIPAGGYFLVAVSTTGANGAALPTPDADGTTIAMSGSTGRVALVNNTTPIAAASFCFNSPGVVDFVGYGVSTSCPETAATGTNLTATTAAFRKAGGCTETDNNSADFEVATVAPRNSSSPTNVCGGGDAAPTVTSTTPANSAVNFPVADNLSVTFSEAVTQTNAFSLTCNSVNQPLTVTGGPTVFTLNPDSDLPNGANCTLTITAANVADNDTDDPPDNMTADVTVNFTTAAAAACTVGTPTEISAVQGNGATTPLNNQTVTVEGIVTGDYQNTTNQLSGFFIQDATPDADPNTSDGIFIYDPDPIVGNVNVGDRVRVTGTAKERFGQTVIEASSLEACGDTGTIAETDITLPFASSTDAEKYEGMLVRFAQTLTVSEVYTLGRYGEVVLSSGGRLVQPTQTENPGAAANAKQAVNNLNRIILDDDSNIQNPDPVIYPAPGLSAANTLRVGYTTQNLTAIMSYGFSAYRLHPVQTITWSATPNPRTATPPAINTSGTPNVKIAAFNVLNYFNGDGLGGGFPTPRGADSTTEFTRQRNKIISALAALNADIVGLIEIENDGSGLNSAIQDLVNGLNTAVGAGTYAAISDPTSGYGTDEIKVTIIYKPSVVTPSGAPLSDTDPINNRAPVAQTFTLNSNASKFSVIVNHFKSKGCTGATGLDTDQGDGQGCYNNRRVQQATRLLTFINTVTAAANDPDVVVVGDLNSYAKEDPITTLLNGGLVNPIPASDFSYVFQGQSGTLDYALISSGLASRVTGAVHWQINAVEPIALDYNTDFKSVGQQTSFYAPDAYRSSDHDPVLLGLELPADVAPSVTSTTPTDNTANIALNAALTVTFSEPVTAASGAFTLVCRGETQPVTVTGGPTTFTITPNAALPPYALCRLTVVAANISDDDTQDPPDNLAANVFVDFSTVRADTVGVFRPSNKNAYLRYRNTAGAPNAIFNFSQHATNDVVVYGDWDGDGITTLGVFRPSTNTWYLKNANNSAAPVVSTFTYGLPGDIPVVGDWDGNGTDTIGVFRPTTGRFFLRNSNSTGPVNVTVIFGLNGDRPVVGDWDGNNTDTAGVWRPASRRFLLTNTASGVGAIAYNFPFGLANDVPFAGDWDGDGNDSVGVYRPAAKTFYLRQEVNDPAFFGVLFGLSADAPMAGVWASIPAFPPQAPTFVPKQ